MPRRPRRTGPRNHGAPAALVDSRPDHEAADLPPIVEVLPPNALAKSWQLIWDAAGSDNRLLRVFRMGKATVIMTRQMDAPGLHVSVSRPDRLPTWDEVARVRYELMPKDRVCCMLLPPVESYVNVNKNCFQILELPEAVGEELV